MALFGKSKIPGVIWRNKSGKIVCPGDRCPQKNCDDTCPVWLNTQGAQALSARDLPRARALLERACDIAPDFYDARNNLGSVYGMSDDPARAYECFRKAHELDAGKVPPLYGLMLATRDLKKTAECLAWCDEYDKLCGDGRSAAVRAAAKKAASREAAAGSGVPPMSRLMNRLLAEGQKEQYISSDIRFPFVPEVIWQAKDVAGRILSETKKRAPMNYINRACALSAYAGMGAMLLWRSDWNGLDKTGIFDMLTAPRGFDRMDEYVTDLIGWQSGSERSARFVAHLRRLIDGALADYIRKDSTINPGSITLLLCDFFYYGMVIGMNHLGM